MSRKILQIALAAVFGAAVVDFLGFKLHAWRPTPTLFAGLMAVAALLALLEIALSLREAMRGPRRLARGGKAAALLGLVLMVGGALGNWLWHVRGYTVMLEGETAPFVGTGPLQAIEGGALARAGELDAVVGLEEVELRDTETGFYPEAVVLVTRPGRDPERLSVLQDVPAPLGSYVLALGAFGFAPRIVVLKGAETLFDETVPFTTRREGESGVSFEGEADVGETGLRVVGAVNLESKNPGVRGHPTVWLALRRGDEEVGSGELQLGHFALAKDDYRLGLAGMKKWAELDVARPNRTTPARFGLGLGALGILAWAVGAWRRW